MASARTERRDRARKRAARLAGFQRARRPGLKAGYDAADTSKRRKAITISTKSEDKELTSSKRSKLVSAARDLNRNFTLAAWAIRKHLDYVSNFTFQCKSGNDDFDREIEGLVKVWSLPENFDAAGRHSRERFFRLAEIMRTLDGDFFIHYLKDQRVSGIEADRIRTPDGLSVDELKNNEKIIHGVKVDQYGRAKAYALNNRTNSASWEFARWVNARYIDQHGYFTRYDQVRGISPLVGAINTMKDVYEVLELSVVKAKIHTLFGIAFGREGAEMPDGFPTNDADDGETPDDDTEKYEVDLGSGPFKLELEPGDKIETIESKTPSAELQNFSNIEIRLALLALDIPFTFYDVSTANYSGARQDLLQYDESAKVKRADNQAILTRWIKWRIITGYLNGEVQIPKSVNLDKCRLEFIPRGIPWIQPLQETEAEIRAIAAGITSPQRVCRRHGEDWYEIQKENEEANEIRKQAGSVQA